MIAFLLDLSLKALWLILSSPILFLKRPHRQASRDLCLVGPMAFVDGTDSCPAVMLLGRTRANKGYYLYSNVMLGYAITKKGSLALQRSWGKCLLVLSNLKYYFKFHVCLSIRNPLSVIRYVIPPAPKIFSLYSVILCRLPGGARQCPCSGHFLVMNKLFHNVWLQEMTDISWLQ